MTEPPATGRSRRLAADDWIEAASQAIAEGGIAAVAVEPLAQRLWVTKGSFYWHFTNRDALLQATLERWEVEDTEAAIAALEGITDPRERLQLLVVRALGDEPCFDAAGRLEMDRGHAFHLALSNAANDPIVRPVLQRVSERRVDYLIECYRAIGFTPEMARFRALLAYAAYVGTIRLMREAPTRVPVGTSAQAYRQHLLATLVPSGDG